MGQSVNEKTLREISQQISQKIEPKIFPKIHEKEIDNKKCILVEFEVNKKLANKVAYYFFKANDIAGFLKTIKKGVFLVNDDEMNDSELEEESIEEEPIIIKKKISSKINKETFDLIYSLGLIKSDFQESLKNIKLALDEHEEGFSHFRLLFDFMFTQNEDGTISEEQFKSSLPKLIEAIKKDLGLEQDNDS